MNTKQRQSGFTIMELMITVFIVAILAVIVIPGMSNFIKNERLTTQINTLLSHLHYTRSEAVLRHKQMVICASADGASCDNGGAWDDGWIVFVDEDADGSVGAEDQILKWRDKLEGDTTITSTGGTSVIYDYRGFTPDTDAAFAICDDRGVDRGRSFSISNTGRVTRITGASSC